MSEKICNLVLKLDQYLISVFSSLGKRNSNMGGGRCRKKQGEDSDRNPTKIFWGDLATFSDESNPATCHELKLVSARPACILQPALNGVDHAMTTPCVFKQYGCCFQKGTAFELFSHSSFPTSLAQSGSVTWLVVFSTSQLSITEKAGRRFLCALKVSRSFLTFAMQPLPGRKQYGEYQLHFPPVKRVGFMIAFLPGFIS